MQKWAQGIHFLLLLWQIIGLKRDGYLEQLILFGHGKGPKETKESISS